MTVPRVSIRSVEEHGEEMVRLVFPDLAFTVDPKAVMYVNGELRVAVPAWIDVPTDVVVVERWLPPEEEQVRLALAGLPLANVERLLIDEQMANMGDSMAQVVLRAVQRAVAGETGAEGAD